MADQLFLESFFCFSYGTQHEPLPNACNLSELSEFLAKTVLRLIDYFREYFQVPLGNNISRNSYSRLCVKNRPQTSGGVEL